MKSSPQRREAIDCSTLLNLPFVTTSVDVAPRSRCVTSRRGLFVVPSADFVAGKDRDCSAGPSVFARLFELTMRGTTEIIICQIQCESSRHSRC